MPTMIKIEADPRFKPSSAAEKLAFDVAKSQGTIEVDHTTGMDNIRLSGGMYRMAALPDEPSTVTVKPLADHSMDELKLMLLNLGIKTEKVMKKSDVVALIQARMDAIEVLDDTE